MRILPPDNLYRDERDGGADERRRRSMAVGMTLDWPIGAVFAHVATPAHLGAWLPDLRGTRGAWRADEGAAFTLMWGARGPRVAGPQPTVAGDMIAYEPPREVAYRLDIGDRRYVLRVTCTDRDGAGQVTHVHVRQRGEGAPLAVDLAGLGEALATLRGREAADGWEGTGGTRGDTIDHRLPVERRATARPSYDTHPTGARRANPQ